MSTPTFLELVQLAAAVCGTPVSAVGFLGAERHVLRAVVGAITMPRGLIKGSLWVSRAGCPSGGDASYVTGQCVVDGGNSLSDERA